MLSDQNYQQHAQRDTTKISANLELTTLSRIPTARFDTPLALVHDKVIIALGGKTSKYHGTKRCEAYDTITDTWINMNSLPFFCVNSTAVVMKDRYLYLMPGSNREMSANNSLLICYLDSGVQDKCLETMQTAPWAQLFVKNQEFINSCPVAAIPLGPDQMMIFGG